MQNFVVAVVAFLKVRLKVLTREIRETLHLVE